MGDTTTYGREWCFFRIVTGAFAIAAESYPTTKKNNKKCQKTKLKLAINASKKEPSIDIPN